MVEIVLILLALAGLALAVYAWNLRQEITGLLKQQSELTRLNENTVRNAETTAARSAAIADGMAEALLVVNPAREIIYLNQAARDILPGPDVVGRRLAEATWGLDLGTLLANALSGKTDLLQETVVWDQHTFLARARPIGPSAEFGAVIVLQDVTELQRLGRARRDFVANISHELRTPLASIKLLVDTLSQGALADTAMAPDLLDKINAEVDALKQLADELFDLAQIESGQAPLKLEKARLPGLVNRTLARFALQAERQRVGLQTRVEQGEVLVDAGKFDKILGNLVHNAIKFTPPGGSVTVDARPAEDMFEVRVADTGQGIASNELPRIFERFYKVDRARTRGESGTGLGLAIARHLVEAHGGKIWVESTEGQGATFYFTVPCA